MMDLWPAFLVIYLMFSIFFFLPQILCALIVVIVIKVRRHFRSQ